jgi:hypothetical protein
MVLIFSLLFSYFAISHATITTDTGCNCALTKGAITTPNASATAVVGCSFKTDWNAQMTEWCLTDQSLAPCGTFQAGFGYVDSCAQASFTDVTVQPASQIEWDQAPYVYYTGQTFNLTWNSQKIQQDEWVRIQYQGVNTRTLTSGSGVNITDRQFAVRLSDSSNSPAVNAPVTLSLPSTPAITANSLQNITVIQSKLMNIGMLSNGLPVASGATLLCDNGNVAISWRGLGQAQFGLVGVSMRSGFGTVVGTALSNLPATANMTVNYTLPRSFNPSGISTYTTTITVQEPGQNAYTGTTVGIRLSAAPSTSPSSTPSNTPSKTPTPSATPSPTTSPTPSETPSQTPSPTSSQTPTPSTTESARASIDYALIARNAAQAVDTQTPAIAGALGGIGGILIIIGLVKWYQHKALTERRRKRVSMTSRRLQDIRNVYGVDSSDPNDPYPVQQSNIVMYTVQAMPGSKKPQK